MSRSDLEQAQKRLEQRRQQLEESEEKENGVDAIYQRILEKRKAQATGGDAAKQQPEAQGHEQKNDKAGAQDQSMADLRMQNFKESNGKLARDKSQLPNLAVQARIFEPVTPGRRKFFKEWHPVSVVGREDVSVWQFGHQLNQLDLTGWLLLIKFADSSLVSSFTKYQFLKAMKKQGSSKDYKWLRAFIDRIGVTQFVISVGAGEEKERFRGSLAPQDYEKGENKFAVQLSRPLAAMFGFDGWSFINIDQRLALGQQQWAQAFHAWCSTNTCPANGFWWRKQDLWQEWGPEYKDLENFMRLFKRRVLKPLYGIEFIKKIQEKSTAIGLWW